MGDKVYDTIIPRNVRVSEAPSYGKPVLVYDLKCVGSEAYLRLATEIIQREKELRAGAATSGRRAAAPISEPGRRLQRDGGSGAVTSVGRSGHGGRAARSRLGRGLAALIGDVGAEAHDRPSARAAQRRVPIEHPAAQSAQSAPQAFADAELDELAASIRERGIIQPIVVRPVRGAPTPSRSSPASGAGARRSAPACTRCRSSCSRSTDERGARARDHRERAARRPQSARGGDRLSVADRRVRLQPGRHRQDRRQEPQPCRQHAAAAEAAGDGEGLYQRRQAHRRPCAHAGRPAERRRAGATRSSSAVSTCARSRRWRARTAASARQRRRKHAHGRQGCRHASRWRSACPMRSACDVTIDHRGNGGGMLQRALSHARAARRRGAAAGTESIWIACIDVEADSRGGAPDGWRSDCGLGAQDAFDLAKGLKDIHDAARRNSRIELQERILAGQQAQSAAGANRLA